jgi:hypothetical protein
MTICGEECDFDGFSQEALASGQPQRRTGYSRRTWCSIRPGDRIGLVAVATVTTPLRRGTGGHDFALPPPSGWRAAGSGRDWFIGLVFGARAGGGVRWATALPLWQS